MNILVFDSEHREGVYKPWAKDYVLSCIHYKYYDNNGRLHCLNTFWFDHKNLPNDFLIEKQALWQSFQTWVDEADIIVGHNLKHDMKICIYCGGINFEGKILWDTQVAEYLISGQDSQRTFGLDSVADHRKIGRKISKIKEYWDAGIHTENIPYELLDEYVQQDVNLTYEIFLQQFSETEGQQIRKVIELQNEFLFCLVDMEMHGLKIDKEKGLAIYLQSKEKVEVIEQRLKQLFGDDRLNLQSNDHLSAALYGGKCKVSKKEWVAKPLKSKPETRYYEQVIEEEVELPRIFKPLPRTELKKKGFWKTDKTTISMLKGKSAKAVEVKDLLMELSVHGKIMQTLIGKDDDAGLLNKTHEDCIHTTFNNSFTTTGRLSSTDPNVMNLPRGRTSPIKEIIIPQYDYLLQWDASQIEWRDAAFLSQDPVMIYEVNNGVDQHIEACVHLMKLPFVAKGDPESDQNRTHAKVFNFRMIYGGSEWGFYLDPKMPGFTLEEWKEIINNFFTKYKGLKDYNDKTISSVWSNNGWLEIYSGRAFRFHKTDYDKKSGGFKYHENAIKNWPIQGNSGGDILPLAAIIIRRGMKKMQLKSRMCLTVHDSLVFDIVGNELKKMVKLCELVGNNLDRYISDYFEVNWNVKLGGECEYGVRYSQLKPITSEEI